MKLFRQKQGKPLHTALKQEASRVLDAHDAHNRLTLVLGLFVAVGLGFTVPVMLDCLWLVSAILGGTVGDWVEIVRTVLLYASFLLIFLPLCMGVYRMAVRMAETRNVLCPKTLMPVKIGLHECFYPFTSPKAYARTLVAGAQIVVRWGSVVLVPIGFVALADLWMPTLKASLSAGNYELVAFAHCLVLLLLTVLGLIVACRLGGYAYLVFAHPDISLRRLGRTFRALRQPYGKCLLRTLRSAGRVLIGAIPVLIPLFLHTLPHLMLSSALYGQRAFDASFPKN